MRSPRRIITSLVFAGLVVAACGSDDESTSSDSTTSTVAATVSAATDDGQEHRHDGNDQPGAGFDDKGLGMLKNGHHEDMVLTELTSDEQVELDRQLAITQEVVAQYPTLGVALDAGFKRAGPFLPGLGIHYMNPKSGAAGWNADGVIDDEDVRQPFIIIFDGTDREAPIAGFMYYSGATEEPEGFPGTNDFWHYHSGVCNQFAEDGINAPLGADRGGSPEDCNAVGGQYMDKSQWMVHAWTVPGYEMTDEQGGVFGEVNPKITCSDGTYFVMPSEQWPDHPMNHCQSALDAPA